MAEAIPCASSLGGATVLSSDDDVYGPIGLPRDRGGHDQGFDVVDVFRLPKQRGHPKKTDGGPCVVFFNLGFHSKEEVISNQSSTTMSPLPCGRPRKLKKPDVEMELGSFSSSCLWVGVFEPIV